FCMYYGSSDHVALPSFPTRRSSDLVDVFLLGWLVSGALLLYAPLSLQRRFTMGLIVPLAVYAGRGLWRVILPKIAERRRGLVIADRKSTRLNSSHVKISYAVFCLKK